MSRAPKKNRAAPSASRSSWRRVAFGLKVALIAVAVGFIYSAALPGDWDPDDDLYLPNHPLLNDPARLWKTWFQPGSMIEYYPITETVQYFQWQTWHHEAAGYVITNILFHLLNALLVWRLLARLGLKWAWWGGLLFAVHPANVESVAWISELKNTLSLAPALMAMTCWIDFEETRRPRAFAWALGLFLASMLCKITMAPFPAVMLLYAWWKRGRVGLRDVAACLPFLVIALVLVFVTSTAGEQFAQRYCQVEPSVPVDGLLSRAALVGSTACFYFADFVWPWSPAPMYAQWRVNPPTWIEILPWFAWGTIFVLCWMRRASWGRHALLGLVFFGLMLAPFLGMKTISYMTYTWVMDHFLYLPMIGLIGLVAAALEWAASRLSPAARPALTTLATLLCLGLAVDSWAYAGVYSSQESLDRDAVRRDPGSAAAHDYWAVALANRERVDDAIAQEQIALQIDPERSDSHFDLGNFYLQASRPGDAVREYSEAIRLRPLNPDAYDSLGVAEAQSGHVPEAMEAYRHAIAQDDHVAQPHNDLANLFLQNGQLDAAIREYQKAVEIAPYQSVLRDNLGAALLQANRRDEALVQFVAASAIDPSDAQAAAAVKALGGSH